MKIIVQPIAPTTARPPTTPPTIAPVLDFFFSPLSVDPPLPLPDGLGVMTDDNGGNVDDVVVGGSVFAMTNGSQVGTGLWLL